jgi:cephalosporin-C deacetylase-like acetyl esterase
MKEHTMFLKLSWVKIEQNILCKQFYFLNYNNMVGFYILAVTLSIGLWSGILPAIIEYYCFGGKEREQKEITKWRKINYINRELKKRGSDLVHEIIKKQSQ